MLESRRGSVCWSRYVADDRRPRDWADAAHELGLAGLWHDGTEERLHTDTFGVQEVYLRELDGALWFSNRLAPLRDLGGRLDADDDAWGAALGFGGFIGSTTPFRQIRRLRAGESVVHDQAGIRIERGRPAWLDATATRAGVDDVRRAFTAALPGRRPRRDRAVTLSGGWDSRLIALAARDRKALPARAWTVHHDDGTADDVVIAGRVAAMLGLPHTVAETRPQAWVLRREEVLDRVEHQTWLHTWLEPMARRVRADGLPLLDGLAGDVLLRALGSDPGGPAHWEQLTKRRMELPDALEPGIAERWRAAAATSMGEAGDLFSGHPAELRLRTLSVRTGRVVAASPFRLFAPEIPVLLPFLTPAFLKVALAVPTEELVDGDFYRDLLRAFDPVIGAVPSTNDLAERSRVSRPLAATGHAIDTAAGIVEADPYVLERLHPRLRTAIAERDRVAIRPVGAVLQWAASYADWRRQNADVLS